MGRYLLLLLICLGSWRAVQAQVNNGISQPAGGDTIAGIVTVEGTASGADFLRYELAFYQEFNPDADWVVFAQGDQPVTNGTLALWDTTVGRNVDAAVFPDGRYQLRLRVVRTDYNYSEYYVSEITVANDAPTPTPTEDEVEGIETRAITGTPPAVASPEELRPAVLPSLTPFPTPSRPPTPVRAGEAVDGRGPATGDGSDGWLARLAAIELDRFNQAFWEGVKFTVMAFAGLALYLIGRRVVRFLWRYVVTRWTVK